MPITPAAVAAHQSESTSAEDLVNAPTDPSLVDLPQFDFPKDFTSETFDGFLKSSQEESTACISRLGMIDELMRKTFDAEMTAHRESMKNDPMEPELVEKMNKRAIDRAEKIARAKRDEQLKMYGNMVDEAEAQLEKRERMLAGLLQVAPNAPSLLEIESFRAAGTAERLKWEQALTANPGYAQLRSLCAYAMTTRNLALAGALAARLAVVSKNNRPISVHKFAAHFVGVQHAKLVLAKEQVTDLRKTVADRKRELMTGKVSMVSRIGAGLRQIAIKTKQQALSDED
jgi:hypothetical protein